MQYTWLSFLHETFFIVRKDSPMQVLVILPDLSNFGQYLHVLVLQDMLEPPGAELCWPLLVEAPLILAETSMSLRFFGLL